MTNVPQNECLKELIGMIHLVFSPGINFADESRRCLPGVRLSEKHQWNNDKQASTWAIMNSWNQGWQPEKPGQYCQRAKSSLTLSVPSTASYTLCDALSVPPIHMEYRHLIAFDIWQDLRITVRNHWNAEMTGLTRHSIGYSITISTG